MKKIALLLILFILVNSAYITDLNASDDVNNLVLNIVPNSNSIMPNGNTIVPFIGEGNDAWECAADGGSWNGYICTYPSPSDCTSNQYWNGSSCVNYPTCSSDEYLSGTTCVKYPTCADDEYLSGRVCVKYPVCNTGEYLDKVNKVCVQIICPTGQYLDGNECKPIICQAGYFLSGNDCIGIPFLNLEFTKNPQTVIISQAVLNDLETIKSSTDLIFNKGMQTAKFLLKEDKNFVFIPFSMVEQKEIQINSSVGSSNSISIKHLVSGFSTGTNNLFESKGISSSQFLGTAFVELGKADYNASNMFDNKMYYSNGANDYLGAGMLLSFELLSRERISSIYSNIMFKMGILNKELSSTSSYVPLYYDNWNYYSSFSTKAGYIRNFSSNISLDMFLGMNWAWLQANNVLIEGYMFTLDDVYSIRPVIGFQLNKNVAAFPQIITPYLEFRAEYELDSVVVSDDIVESNAKGYYVIGELGITYIPMKYSPFALNGAITGTYGEIKKSLGAQFQVEYQF